MAFTTIFEQNQNLKRIFYLISMQVATTKENQVTAAKIHNINSLCKGQSFNKYYNNGHTLSLIEYSLSSNTISSREPVNYNL